MSGQKKLRTANEILSQATPEQVRWVMERLTSRTDGEAATRAGVHPTTVSRWSNKEDLDEAVLWLLLERVEGARSILVQAAIQAAQVLVSELSGRHKLAAARDILDRVGLSSKRALDVTSGGEPLPADTIRIIVHDSADASEAHSQDEPNAQNDNDP